MRYLVLILAVCVLAIVGCDSHSPEPSKMFDVETWQCLSASDLYLAVIVRGELKSYCEVRTNTDVGAVSFLTVDLSDMLTDRYFRQVEDTRPLLGPPPPGWTSRELSDADQSPRIDGTPRVPMHVHSRLPVHDAIAPGDRILCD